MALMPWAAHTRGHGRLAVFLDKDGTLVEDVPYNADPDWLRFTPEALPTLRRLADHGYALVLISNQPGLALGRFGAAAWDRLKRTMQQRLWQEAGVRLTDIVACPHAPGPGQTLICPCRKPAPGLIQLAAATHGLSLAGSWMVGDILDDIEAGTRAGCRTVLLDVGHETEWRLSPWRQPHHRARDLGEAADVMLGQGVS